MNDIEPIWAKVRFWRLVKNVFLIIDVVLLVFAILTWMNGEGSFFQKSHGKQGVSIIIGARQGANMRETPDRSAAILCSIPYKSQMQSLDTVYSITKSKWYKVEYQAKVGWIWSKNVKNM